MQFYNRLNRRGFWAKLILLAIYIGMTIVIMKVLAARNIVVVSGYDQTIADALTTDGTFPSSIHYPPGMGVILFVLTRVFSLPVISYRIFKACMLALGLMALVTITEEVTKKPILSVIVGAFAIFNPYFLWVGLSARDFAVSFGLMASSLLLLILARRTDKPVQYSSILVIGATFLAILGTLVRLTNLFIFFAWLIVLLFLSRENRRPFFVGGLIFIIFLGGYLFRNYRLTGRFSLSSETYPFVQGNHPAYLYCHPKFDVDGCLENEIADYLNANFPGADELEKSIVLRDLAVEYIVSDPLSFIHRAIVKTIWHWFNLEKIPNYTAEVEWNSESNTLVVHDDIQIGYGLVYAIYKLAYLPVFIMTLIYMIWKRKTEWLPFIMPYVVLWPAVVLTFPDTRYKMTAETLALLPMALFLIEIAELHKKTRRSDIPQPEEMKEKIT